MRHGNAQAAVAWKIEMVVALFLLSTQALAARFAGSTFAGAHDVVSTATRKARGKLGNSEGTLLLCNMMKRKCL